MYKTPGRQGNLRPRRPHPLLGRQPGEPAQHPRQAVHRVLLRLPHQPQPARGALGEVEVREVLRGRRLQRPVRQRPRRHGDRADHRARRLLQERLRQHQPHPRDGQAPSGALHHQRRLRPARRREGARIHPLDEGDLRHQGREALHRRMERRVQGLQARRPGLGAVPRALRQARDQEHPHPQGPDDHPAEQGRLRRRRRRPGRHRLPEPQLHRRALRPAAARRLLLDRGAGDQRLRAASPSCCPSSTSGRATSAR